MISTLEQLKTEAEKLKKKNADAYEAEDHLFRKINRAKLSLPDVMQVIDNLCF